MSSSDLRIDSLNLSNFRCFPACATAFHPSLTVFVAENGQGKSAILDAISIALSPMIDGIAGTKRSHPLRPSDVHLLRQDGGEMKPADQASFEAEGQIAGAHVRWSRSLNTKSHRSRPSTKGLRQLYSVTEELRTRVGRLDEAGVLPLVALYGTGRLWREQEASASNARKVIDVRSRLAGYIDCLAPNSSFKFFFEWFENAFRDIGDPAYAREVFGRIGYVDVVKDAVRGVLQPTGWQELNWDPVQRTIVVEHSEFGRLPVFLLSDGVRNMVSLVADIAHRCVRLNPQLGGEAARRTPGVLLIDEVDMHLHPRWQQIVLKLIQNAFPSLQMIVSTHSPHVLSTVSADSIRIIELSGGKATVRRPVLETKGTESSAVLAEVMDVNATPPIEEAKWEPRAASRAPSFSEARRHPSERR